MNVVRMRDPKVRNHKQIKETKGLTTHSHTTKILRFGPPSAKINSRRTNKPQNKTPQKLTPFSQIKTTRV